MTLFRQCRLHKPPDTYTYTWLPLKLASDGKRIILRGEPGWVVDEAYTITKDEGEVRVMEDIHRRHRGITDI